MKPMRFTDLVAWKAAHRVALSVYRETESYPPRERFGLSGQLRRAAASVAANIAEGFARRSRVEKARFYNIAQGSLEEVRYFLILAADLGYRVRSPHLPGLDDAVRLLQGLVNATLRPPSSAP